MLPPPRPTRAHGRPSVLTATPIGFVAVVAELAPPGPSVTAGVQLSMRDGRVWLVANHATVAEILSEWARVGHTHLVGAELLAGEPLTLDIQGMRELDALGVILRSAGGFVTVSRPPWLADDLPDVSRFARLVIVPHPARTSDLPPPAIADTPPAAMQMPAFTEGGARRVIGADGQPVPDDQQGAPPIPAVKPPPRPGGGAISR